MMRTTIMASRDVALQMPLKVANSSTEQRSARN